jgi:uncharacterized protein YggU (UPF0235/DUF167 family)
MRSTLFLCFLFFSVVLAIEGKLDPTDGTLTKPLIVDPNALTEDEAKNVATVAQVLANEPDSAKESPPPADEDALAGMLDAGAGTGGAAAPGADAAAGGATDAGASDTSSDAPADPAAESSAIEKEIKLLSSLIEHGKAIAQALPEKEQRLKELAAKLSAAGAAQRAQGAEAQLAEQKLLLAQIQLKITALKKKLEDLETTETKLKASIDKVEGAVQANDQVTHELNQEAAVASVGGDASSGAAAAAAPAAAEAAPPAAFLDKSVEAVTRQARAALRDTVPFTKKFLDLLR